MNHGQCLRCSNLSIVNSSESKVCRLQTPDVDAIVVVVAAAVDAAADDDGVVVGACCM